MRRSLAAVLCIATAALAACGGATAAPQIPQLAREAADGLIARHITQSAQAWAWRSSIQAPHIQADRDVGAAGTAMGFLSLYAHTHNAADLDAARRAGNWLIDVAQHSGNGLRWPDYVDPQETSKTHFTSFDDGAAGIGDLLWRLGEATGDRRYRDTGVAAMRWLEQQALPAGGSCPAVACRWKYYDAARNDYRTGMGEGMAGIVYAFDVFAERTRDPGFERYARAGAIYLERQIARNGAISERPGTTEYDTGYLSGAAGDAFMFLRLYQHTHARRWLNDARRLLRFDQRVARRQRQGFAWPIELDPSERSAATRRDNALLATGMEEGAAGIGWTELQAYRVTRDRGALRWAERAGDWLLSVALRQRGGYAWAEDLHGDLISTSLNNGTPGTAWFLHDLAVASGRRRYDVGARRGADWIASVRRSGRKGVYWFEHLINGRWFIPQDESWHWGGAGITAFLARMAGGPVDMPGEQSAL